MRTALMISMSTLVLVNVIFPSLASAGAADVAKDSISRAEVFVDRAGNLIDEAAKLHERGYKDEAVRLCAKALNCLKQADSALWRAEQAIKKLMTQGDSYGKDLQVAVEKLRNRMKELRARADKIS